MIASLSRHIVDFLIREKSIPDDQTDIYQYGVEITLSSVLNILLVLAISLVVQSVLSGILFLAVFIILRQFTGGYHATTYFRCNAVLAATFLMVYGFSRYAVLSFWINCALGVLGIVMLLLFAPVANAHKPLTKEACEKHKKYSVAIYVFLLFVELFLFRIAPNYSRLIFATLIAIVILIMVEKWMQRRGFHES